MIAAGLPDRNEVRSAVQAVLDAPGADGVVVVVYASSVGLTRFARSEIVQSTARHELHAQVHAAVGSRTASASTNQLGAVHLGRALEQAVQGARSAPEDELFPGFAPSREVSRPEQAGRWDEATATCPASERGRVVASMLKSAGGDGTAGFYETGAHVYAVFSSTGVDCYDAYSRCSATALVEEDGATGWGEASSSSAGEIDAEGVARRAAAKARAAGRPKPLSPGEHTVVLEPPAVAEMISYLAYAGFGAKQVMEEESFLTERAGQTVAPPGVTIADDIEHPLSIGIGFDFEGTLRCRVPVIDEGLATGPVTDLRTAKALATESTGHSSGSNELGPYASNVVMSAGDRSLDELVGGVDHGVLVTRFHYTNVLDRKKTLLTGMTRDGTFRISGGEVGEPVRNMRFTQSVLDLLANVTGVGREQVCAAPEWGSFGSTVTPALAAGAFRFTSATSH
ncbi:TldD/PmbA family protein [soil metagenome]